MIYFVFISRCTTEHRLQNETMSLLFSQEKIPEKKLKKNKTLELWYGRRGRPVRLYRDDEDGCVSMYGYTYSQASGSFRDVDL